MAERARSSIGPNYGRTARSSLLLVWRSLKARYRQTYFGLLWAVAQPLVALGVYSLVFGKLVGVPSEGARIRFSSSAD